MRTLTSFIQRCMWFGLAIMVLAACGTTPEAQPSSTVSTTPSVAPTEPIASAKPSAAAAASPATPETVVESPAASRAAEGASDLQRAYAPFVFLQAGVVAVEDAARRAQSGEVEGFELLGHLIGAGVLVRAADEAFKSDAPTADIEAVWMDARAANRDLSAVLKRWLDREIDSADIPGELESIKPRVDTIMDNAERDLSAAYDVDRTELARIRAETIAKMQEIMASPAAEASVAPDAAAETSSAPVAVEPGTSRAEPVGIGTPIVFESWTVTVTDVLRGDAAQQAIAAANQFNDPPREGFEYVIATLQLENTSDKPEAQSASSAISLRATGDRNVAYASAAVVPPQPFEGELFPTGTATGQQVLEVPSGEGNLMLMVSALFSFDEPVRFVAVDENARMTPDPALNTRAPTELGTSRDSAATPGETVITDDWEVTLLELKRGEEAAALLNEANQFNDPTETGTEYVLVRVRVLSIGSSEPDAVENVGSGWLKLTGANNVVYEVPSVVAPEPRLDALLFPGGEAEGWVALSAAQGEENLVAIWEPLFSFDNDQTRYLALQ